MNNNKPLILITNDDGVSAKGINKLISFIRPIANIFVVAPDSPRSGNSCALTVGKTVSFKLLRKEEGLTIYSCSGTPVDCVKLGLHLLDERTPDLVVSGINHGSNASVNVHYSGTMGAVIEGCLKGIPSIGFSLFNHDEDADFNHIEGYVREITQKVVDNGLTIGCCLNVNFPEKGNIKGVTVCRQAQGVWTKEWDRIEGVDDAYTMTGVFIPGDSLEECDDHEAVMQGYVSITPTKVDMTDYEEMNKLKDLFL